MSKMLSPLSRRAVAVVFRRLYSNVLVCADGRLSCAFAQCSSQPSPSYMNIDVYVDIAADATVRLRLTTVFGSDDFLKLPLVSSHFLSPSIHGPPLHTARRSSVARFWLCRLFYVNGKWHIMHLFHLWCNCVRRMASPPYIVQRLSADKLLAAGRQKVLRNAYDYVNEYRFGKS